MRQFIFAELLPKKSVYLKALLFVIRLIRFNPSLKLKTVQHTEFILLNWPQVMTYLSQSPMRRKKLLMDKTADGERNGEIPKSRIIRKFIKVIKIRIKLATM